jgi:hypothetical protein
MSEFKWPGSDSELKRTGAWDRGHPAPQPGEREKIEGAAAAADEHVARTRPQTPTAKKRHADAVKKVRTILFELSSAPALRSGQAFDEKDLENLVDDYLKDENLPDRVNATVREQGLRIVKLVHESGAKKEALEVARSQSVSIADDLSKSAWKGDTDEVFDAQSAADAIGRVG